MYASPCSIASSRESLGPCGRSSWPSKDQYQPSGRGHSFSLKHGKPCAQPHPVADGGAARVEHLLAVSLLSRLAHRAGLIIVRETFVRRSHPGTTLAVDSTVGSHENHMLFRTC